MLTFAPTGVLLPSCEPEIVTVCLINWFYFDRIGSYMQWWEGMKSEIVKIKGIEWFEWTVSEIRRFTRSSHSFVAIASLFALGDVPMYYQLDLRGEATSRSRQQVAQAAVTKRNRCILVFKDYYSVGRTFTNRYEATALVTVDVALITAASACSSEVAELFS